ncbi:MAG: hypothetical protein RL769_262 [Pseudomonadota bacterium]
MKNNPFIILLIFVTFSCSNTTDPVTGERIIIEPDPAKKAREAAARGGGLFGEIGGQKSSGQTVNFANSNVLWRATLKSLDFLPLLNADYSGGIIIYDWYSQTNNPKEQIKISVQFLNNELRSDSIKITAHKKICETVERCSNSTLDQNFANSIKDSIIASARTLKIEEAKKEKK